MKFEIIFENDFISGSQSCKPISSSGTKKHFPRNGLICTIKLSETVFYCHEHVPYMMYDQKITIKTEKIWSGT